MEGVDEFGLAEAGFDAEAHVVAGDGVEAGEEVQELAGEDVEAVAVGFGDEEEAGGGGEVAAESGELRVFEVVEEEVGDDDFGFGEGGGEEVLLEPGGGGGPFGRGGLEVEGEDLVGLGEVAGDEAAGEGAVAGAEFEDAVAGAEVGSKLAADPAVVAHEEVDEAEVAPGADGVRVMGGEGVEDFGLDSAVGHAARFLRKAVSTVRPGPKARAQVRGSAWGTGWRSISWRTKRMVGLLMLPKWRRMWRLAVRASGGRWRAAETRSRMARPPGWTAQWVRASMGQPAWLAAVARRGAIWAPRMSGT